MFGLLLVSVQQCLCPLDQLQGVLQLSRFTLEPECLVMVVTADQSAVGFLQAGLEVRH